MIRALAFALLLAGCAGPEVEPEQNGGSVPPFDTAEEAGSAGAPASEPEHMDPAGIDPGPDRSSEDRPRTPPEVDAGAPEPEEAPPPPVPPEPEPVPVEPEPDPPPPPPEPTDVVLWSVTLDRDFARTMTDARAWLLVQGPGGFESTAVITLGLGEVDASTADMGQAGALLAAGTVVDVAPVFGWDQASGAAEAPWFGQAAPDLDGATVERLRVHGTVTPDGAMSLTWEVRGQP